MTYKRPISIEEMDAVWHRFLEYAKNEPNVVEGFLRNVILVGIGEINE